MEEPPTIYYTTKNALRKSIDQKFSPVADGQTQYNEGIRRNPALANGKACKFHYFHFFLKVGIYCGMIPLHLTFNRASRHYQISRMHIFLRIQVCVISLLPILLGIADLRETYQNRREQHAIAFYFDVVKSLTWTNILPLVWTGLFHLKIGRINDMLEIISHSSLLSPHKYVLNWLLVISTQLVWVLISITYPLFLPESWTLNTAYDYLLSTGRYALFINTRQTLNSNEDLTTGNIMLAVFGFVLLVSATLQNALITSALGIASFTIWEATSRFMSDAKTILLQPSRKLNLNCDSEGKKLKNAVAQLHNKFNELVTIANSINATWSVLIFWLVLGTTVRNSTDLDYVIHISSYSFKIYGIYSMIYIAAAVVLSAESSRKIQSFRGDIVNPENALLSTESSYKAAKLLLYQVDDSTICIGQGKFYEVDYALISQVVVIIVTLFVIVVQYNAEEVGDIEHFNCTCPSPPS